MPGMRAMWKGAISFGLVNVPVRLMAATSEHDIRFHQLHAADGGRIKMQRVCSKCGEIVEYRELAKGYEDADGRQVQLSDEDLANLPVPTIKQIEVLEFVPADQVDPLLLNKTYYLAPEKTAAKPYALLQKALAAVDRMAVVKIAVRSRESVAILRVREDVIVLQTLLWSDELRPADFETYADDVEVKPQELAMAHSLIASLSGDFDPTAYTDDYTDAVHELVTAKLEGAPLPVASEGSSGGEVIDLLEALQRSVAQAKAAQESGGSRSDTDAAA